MLYDNDDDKVQLNICLPRYYRGMLRIIAAERMVEDPDKVESAASVGAEIIREYLEAQDKEGNKERKEE
ncbi:MAG: hypothetical protein IPI61_02580 [Syntrophaceae bacterium]|jgi:hypothetical protein|nr:hypothetical protein [Syntrophaceae bacterium]HOV66060.1 hypothetical protein [Bacillota bacterium]